MLAFFETTELRAPDATRNTTLSDQVLPPPPTRVNECSRSIVCVWSGGVNTLASIVVGDGERMSGRVGSGEVGSWSTSRGAPPPLIDHRRRS